TFGNGSLLRAGESGIGHALEALDELFVDMERALEIVNNWRAGPFVPAEFPLNSLQVVLTRRAKEVQSTAWCPGASSGSGPVTDKLKRVPKTLTLSQMQEIGGCRAVLPSVADVRLVVVMYKQKRRGGPHVLSYEDDYIAQPNRSGYRSHHLIYRYQARGEAVQRPEDRVRSEFDVTDLKKWRGPRTGNSACPRGVAREAVHIRGAGTELCVFDDNA